MGRSKGHTSSARAALAALAVSLLALLLSASAQAGPPTHPGKASLDVSGLNKACGAAVDNKGDLYAASAGEDKIKVYAAADHTTPIAEIANANEPCGLAVDTKGRLFVSEQATGNVAMYVPDAYPLSATPSYGPAVSVDSSGKAEGIAVDRVDDRLYVARGDRVDVYRSEVQQLSVTGTGGSFKLKFEGEETAAIAHNASAAEVQAALEGLAAIGAGEVSVTGSYTIAFGSTDVPQLEVVSSLTGNEQQAIAVDATAGTYKLGFGGQETASIAYNASAAEVQGALEALANIAPGDVALGGGPGGPGGTNPYTVTFAGAYANTNVNQMTVPASSLTGSAAVQTAVQGAGVGIATTSTGSATAILEDPTADYTGVAAYTYTASTRLYISVADSEGDEVKLFSGPSLEELKPRRTLEGPKAGEDFGFGPAGTAVAADPATGHFLVYDEAHETVDEFDATGEFFSAITSGAFEDAAPAALAVERSGLESDGTIYVGAGSGSGAELLAYGPVVLETPPRKPLTGLSAKLTVPQARAIATDRFGNVYVSAEAMIYVYDSSGNKLTEFEDERKAYRLAVDSEGHLYVLDGTVTTEQELTYYTPSEFPPDATTAYTRRVSPLLASDLINQLAVDPVTDRVYIGRGNSAGVSNKRVQEFSSVKEGSAGPVIFAPFFKTQNGVSGLDAYGKNGDVYVANTGPNPISVIDAEEDTELLARITGAGCPAGAMGLNQQIGVEQSNGHIIEFKPGQGGNSAREYDAAGTCIAEFGAFSTNSSSNAIAVDSACAIHRNEAGEIEPLDETTTPTCAQFDPSNGNAYIAFDGNDNGVQPYDVTAFGPLEYQEVEEEEPDPEEFELKVNKDGSGTGTVTSAPSGISCGSTCAADFEEDTLVTLTGSPGANSKPVAWTGCDSVNGENKCLVTIDDDTEVTATLDLEAHLLSVSKTGSGTGKVTSSPPGIDCGSECSAPFTHGTVVTLQADPDAGSEFTGFSGACTGLTCEVTMTVAKSVTANFDEESTTPKFLLSVDVEGTGSGTVTSDKGLIACDPVCSDEYPEGTVVVLTATPDPGSVFVSWKYCDKEGVNGRKCTMTVDKAQTVKAVFTTTHALEVSRAGSGLGKVQSSPGGILCLNNCSETTASFKEGVIVALKQTPAKHFHFVQWLGDCTGTDPCEPAMGEDHEVGAEFAEDAKHLLTLTKSGGGAGTVKSSLAGINCGATCSQQVSAYYQGEVVELTATPGKGSAFGGWSGGVCAGTGTCTVTISEAKEVTAEFK